MIQRICVPYIRIMFKSSATLRRYHSRKKPPSKDNITKNCVYSTPCSCVVDYKGKTSHLLKVRVGEPQKVLVNGAILKLGMAVHIWKKEGGY